MPYSLPGTAQRVGTSRPTRQKEADGAVSFGEEGLGRLLVRLHEHLGYISMRLDADGNSDGAARTQSELEDVHDAEQHLECVLIVNAEMGRENHL